MAGRVEDGDVVTVTPLGERELHPGDVVLVRVHGREYMHLIKVVQGGCYLIGNYRGGVNGWVGRQAIAGVATEVASCRS